MKNIACAFGVASLSAAMAVELPEVLKTADGRPVDSVATWESARRPEVLELFKTHVFGRNAGERPAALRLEVIDTGTAMLDGKALRKRINIRYSGPGGEGTLRVSVFIPKAAKPAPAFLVICNRPEQNIDPSRNVNNPFWPVEELVARGYAALSFQTDDIDPDTFDGFTNGVHGVFQPDPTVRKADSWGTLAA